MSPYKNVSGSKCSVTHPVQFNSGCYHNISGNAISMPISTSIALTNTSGVVGQLSRQAATALDMDSCKFARGYQRHCQSRNATCSKQLCMLQKWTCLPITAPAQCMPAYTFLVHSAQGDSRALVKLDCTCCCLGLLHSTGRRHGNQVHCMPDLSFGIGKERRAKVTKSSKVTFVAGLITALASTCCKE